MFTVETRVGKTTSRSATIVPKGMAEHRANRFYTITLHQRGTLVSRTYEKRVKTLSAARTIAREWCR